MRRAAALRTYINRPPNLTHNTIISETAETAAQIRDKNTLHQDITLFQFLNMSSKDNSEAEDTSSCCCASCGTAENDDTKLKRCNACYLVRYCSVKCQKEHWSKHKKECKKRAAELRDELLFKQPESSYLGDCPICLIPLPLDGGNTIKPCCSKVICDGCDYTNLKREIEMGLKEASCPFCRKISPNTDEEGEKLMLKRVEANDPVAMQVLGTQRINKGDYKGAFDYWTKAAKLGDVMSHYQLFCIHKNGHGVARDKKIEAYHMEKAAIGGHHIARFNLGCLEWENGRRDRATKHWIIAAKLGHDNSLHNLKRMCELGAVNKEDFAAALRAYHATVDATKSPQREEAKEFDRTAPARFGPLGKN